MFFDGVDVVLAVIGIIIWVMVKKKPSPEIDAQALKDAQDAKFKEVKIIYDKSLVSYKKYKSDLQYLISMFRDLTNDDETLKLNLINSTNDIIDIIQSNIGYITKYEDNYNDAVINQIKTFTNNNNAKLKDKTTIADSNFDKYRDDIANKYNSDPIKYKSKSIKYNGLYIAISSINKLLWNRSTYNDIIKMNEIENSSIELLNKN